MKVTVLCLCVLFAVSSASLWDLLQHIHAQPYFNKLPEDDKLLFTELLGMGESGELTNYIDHIGMDKVLTLGHKLPASEQKIYFNYLHAHYHGKTPIS